MVLVGHERGFGKLRNGTVGWRIFKSADGGESWRAVAFPGEADVKTLSVFSTRSLGDQASVHPSR